MRKIASLTDRGVIMPEIRPEFGVTAWNRIRRPFRSRRMTIAAGLVCSDGVVLFADTEMSLSTFKLGGAKAFVCTKGKVKVGVVGAGHTDYIEHAITEICRTVHDCNSTVSAYRSICKVLVDVHKEHIYPDPNASKHSIQLLIGVSEPGNKALLFKTFNTVVNKVYSFEAIGTGWELASYLLDKSYRESVTVAGGVVVATKVLLETKRYVQGCGGDSHVIYMSDGIADFVAEDQIEDRERYLKAFDQAIEPVMMAGPDLKVTQNEFMQLIAKSAQTLETLRSTKFLQIQNEMLQAKSLPPSGPTEGDLNVEVKETDKQPDDTWS
jgi:20S proteasome alpha/beta subunit